MFMNDDEKSAPEMLESEEMWTQRAIDKPEVVLDELRRLKENQQTPDTNR
jgi:hypothetical protein